MHGKQALAALGVAAGCLSAWAQLPSQPQLKIDATSRILSVSAEERVSVDPDLAIVHIGYETRPADAKSAYADGARISNTVVGALKQAGIAETAIRSEFQRLEPVDARNHKFKLVQSWTVKTPPERAAEILDVAVTAGATDSGEIDWTVEDVHSLEDKALDQAASRARSDAAVLAKAGGARLGNLLYLTNQVTGAVSHALPNYNNAVPTSAGIAAAPVSLAIEPRKVSRTATVYAVYAIE